MLKTRYPGESVTLFNDLQNNDYGYATLNGRVFALPLYVVASRQEYAQHVGSVNSFRTYRENGLENAQHPLLQVVRRR